MLRRPDPTRGLFETLLVVGGRPVALRPHLDRLERSALELYGATLPFEVTLDAMMACTGIALGRERIEIRFKDGRADGWSTYAKPIDPELFFPPWESGANLCSVEAGDWSGAHKLTDRDWLERKEAELDGEVPLLIGADGAVLEAGRANVFAVIDGALVTPPLDGRILPGTARAATLELAEDLGIETATRTLTVEDLHRCGEVFLTSSVRGVRPARSLDNRPLPGHGTTDLIAAALRKRWMDL